jgi:hypothetical protein
VWNCEVTVTNSIIWGNSAARDNEIGIILIHDGGNPTCIVSYSNVKDGLDDIEIDYYVEWGNGNIDADPCFVDPGYWDTNGTPLDANDDFWISGDYHLKSQAGRWEPDEGRWTMDDVTSPCIDAGNPMSPLGEEPFPNGGIVNMGAYGGTREASKSYFGGPPCEIVVAGDLNGDCAVNFKDFALLGLHWIEPNEPFVIPEEAWNPRPKIGAKYVPTDGTMTWKLGSVDTTGYGVSYEIYIGKDWRAVFHATGGSPEYMDHVNTESYDYSFLEYGTLHFWRVDTVLTKLVPPFTKVVTKGRVWNFTTVTPVPPCKGVGCSGE